MDIINDILVGVARRMGSMSPSRTGKRPSPTVCPSARRAILSCWRARGTKTIRRSRVSSTTWTNGISLKKSSRENKKRTQRVPERRFFRGPFLVPLHGLLCFQQDRKGGGGQQGQVFSSRIHRKGASLAQGTLEQQFRRRVFQLPAQVAPPWAARRRRDRGRIEPPLPGRPWCTGPRWPGPGAAEGAGSHPVGRCEGSPCRSEAENR